MSARGAVATATSVHKWYRRGDEHGNWRSLVPGRFGETRPGPDALRVLDDVDFAVGAGQAVGLVGDNGAGKSTLLRILAGVTRPSAGSVEVRGSVAAALSLGVGFDPDLTGAENLGLTATLLGLSGRDLRARRSAIVDFSGVGSFLDMPLRRYSNGMRSRLGLALIMSVEADLVLVDEALSVGDWEFRRQAMERIRQLHAAGTALVIVSHGLWTTAQLCDSITHLERGRVVAAGEPAEVINDYLGPEHLMEDDPTIDVPTLDVLHDPSQDPGVAVTSLRLEPEAIAPDGGFSFVASITVDRPLDAQLVVSIHSFGRVAFLERAEGPSEVLRSPGTWTVRGRIERLPLGPGPYRVRLAAIEARHGITIGLASRSATLEVTGDLAAAPGVHLAASFTIAGSHAGAEAGAGATGLPGSRPVSSPRRPRRADRGDPAP